MSFTEEWFSQESQDALVALAESTADVRGLVIEVGCWEGRSTVALANAVHPAKVQAVDTWEGSPGEISASLAASPGRDVYATFCENINELTAGNVCPRRVGWRSYFDALSGPIRFLHIDAEHTYREVHDNIVAALRHMAPGGVICGDDVHHPPVQQAVFETLGNVGVTATLWHWRAPE